MAYVISGKKVLEIEVTGGEGTALISYDPQHETLRWIAGFAPDSGYTFTTAIKDLDYNLDIWSYPTTGSFGEQIDLPLKGDYQITITGASAGTYKVYIVTGIRE